MHILLVDDHAVVRQGYCALLTMMLPETRVDEAENAQQALKILGQQSVDLVILDINLEASSGLTLAGRIT
ncbi:MAG: response regulator transcription factor, partial [Aestuariibacter sp.]|nr:response regulator transcription factor [Aestuariibacter sp.]